MATEPVQPSDIPSQVLATPAHPATMAAQLETGSTSVPGLPGADKPLPEPIFKTPRLLLRNMHPQDLISMHSACQPPSITKYMTYAFAYPYTIQHAETWIKMNLTDSLPNYVIVLPEDPKTVIGGIGLKPGSDVQSHTAEIGYWIGEPWWGKGYASEALVGLTDWVFSMQGEAYGIGEGKKGFSRLWAGVMGGNDASMKILQKCGYAPEGVMKGHVEKHGIVMDLHLFGMTITDWEQSRRQ